MDITTSVAEGATQRPLQRWMRIVGGFYLLMGVFNTPPIIAARMPMQYPDLGIPVDSGPAQALVDVWFMFGLEVAVIGVALLYFSRSPVRNIALVWTVIGLEVVRGIADDLYLIARGNDPLVYSTWVLVHLGIILTGVLAARRVRKETTRP